MYSSMASCTDADVHIPHAIQNISVYRSNIIQCILSIIPFTMGCALLVDFYIHYFVKRT